MQGWGQTFLDALTLVVMLLGLFGLVVPIFPGLVVIWLAGGVYGIVSGFGPLGWAMFGVMTLLMLIGNVADNLLMGAKAKEGGASWISIAAAFLAGIAGSVLLPPIGGLLAAPVALFLAEFLRHRNVDASWRATSGMMMGCGWAFAARFALGVIMIGAWAIWAWV